MLIASAREGDEIVIRVCDNGKGFDTGAIRNGAVGIKNCIERLRLIVGAETSVQAEPGEGTAVTIKNPHNENWILQMVNILSSRLLQMPNK